MVVLFLALNGETLGIYICSLRWWYDILRYSINIMSMGFFCRLMLVWACMNASTSRNRWAMCCAFRKCRNESNSNLLRYCSHLFPAGWFSITQPMSRRRIIAITCRTWGTRCRRWVLNNIIMILNFLLTYSLTCSLDSGEFRRGTRKSYWIKNKVHGKTHSKWMQFTYNIIFKHIYFSQKPEEIFTKRGYLFLMEKSTCCYLYSHL